MITLNPALPDRFLVLERHETFAEYSRAYGDRLTGHYEDNGVIVVPHVPIDFDLALFETIVFPAAFKKMNALHHPVYRRRDKALSADPSHPLVRITKGNVVFAAYLQSQIASFNFQLTQGLQVLFPRYRLPHDPSISWRMTLTENEMPHLDVFGGGGAYSEGPKQFHRLKVFVNIDVEPRHWRISHDLPGVLKAARRTLPPRLPADVNVLNDVINKSGLLAELPWHDVRFPRMSAVIANGETVAHWVLFGRRTVAFETHCQAAEMLDPAKSSHRSVAAWISDAGFEVDDDPIPRSEKYIATPAGYVY